MMKPHVKMSVQEMDALYESLKDARNMLAQCNSYDAMTDVKKSYAYGAGYVKAVLGHCLQLLEDSNYDRN